MKIPKKGDTTECTNWRGITLLSVVSKVFTRINLTRIQQAVDRRLRREQAGFCKGRSCTEQDFHPKEYNKTMYGMASIPASEFY